MRARTTVLLTAAVPVTRTVAAAVLRAGRWQLYADRHRIHLTPLARRCCPHCQGAGGRWTGGPHPEMDACPCWSQRRALRIQLWPLPGLPAEEPF